MLPLARPQEAGPRCLPPFPSFAEQQSSRFRAWQLHLPRLIFGQAARVHAARSAAFSPERGGVFTAVGEYGSGHFLQVFPCGDGGFRHPRAFRLLKVAICSMLSASGLCCRIRASPLSLAAGAGGPAAAAHRAVSP